MSFFPSTSSPVLSITLSRPAAMCGGVMPLAWLVSKLSRAGETAAVHALEDMAPPLTRVKWTASGNSLQIGEVR